MTHFDDRKREFESRFQHEQELAFKAKARRNRLFGLWAAGHLGLDGAAAEAYAKSVIEADFGKPGDDHILAKVAADLVAKGAAMPASQLADELHRLAAEAKRQLMRE